MLRKIKISVRQRNRRIILTKKMIGLVKPAMEASLSTGTRKPKDSHMQYWSIFCTKYEKDQQYL